MKKTSLYALVFIASTSCVSLKNESRGQLALATQFDLAAGFTGNEQEPPDDYAQRFQPYGGSMDVEKHNHVFSTGLGFQPELRGYLGSTLILGALLRYEFYSTGFLDQRVSEYELDWYDPVVVQSVTLRRGPSAGFLIGASTFQHAQLILQASAFPYALANVRYRGVDVQGSRNYSVPIERDVFESGLGLGMRLDYRPNWEDINFGRVGVFFDEVWSAWSLGIGWTFIIPLYESDQKIRNED